MSSARDSQAPVLASERLILRTPHEHDAPALRDYYVRNDDRFARWREARSHDLDDHVRSIAEAAEAGDDIKFLAFPSRGSELVAVVTLHGFTAEPPQAMIAYTVDRSYEGRGYASEAVLRVAQYAREERGLTALSAYYEPENARSERLLQRLGFEVVHRTPVIPGFEKLMRAHNLAMLRLS